MQARRGSDGGRAVMEADPDEDFDMRALARLGLWGLCALAAVALVIIAARSEPGARRLASLVGGSAAQAKPSRTVDGEARRLAEAVRLLSADRDQLMTRVNALEQNLADLTGSIPTRRASGTPSASPLPASLRPADGTSGTPAAAPGSGKPTPLVPVGAAEMSPALGEVVASAAAVERAASGQEVAAVLTPATRVASGHASAVGPAPASQNALVTRTEFGVDVGGASTIEGLRALWISVKGTRPAMFDGLQPVVSVREGAKRGSVELRLVAGPLSNAGTAARLCAALADAGLFCHPTVYDGQQLAAR
jgi:hypothetical protein